MSSRIGWALMTAIGLACSAASADPKASATDEQSSGDAVVETPALPYLTLMLVRDPAVHKELRLDQRQVQRIEATIAKVDQRFWILRDVPVATCGQELDRLLQQLRGGLREILTVDQRARLEQIVLQARGLKALASADLADRLKLSTGQIASIRKLVATPSDMPADDSRTTHDKVKASQASGVSSQSRQIHSLLSAEQSSQLASLVGQPFDLTQVRRIGCQAPELKGAEAWLNSEPLTLESQRGKVVAVHFWAFGCINCIRNLPHYQGWYESFPTSQLTIIGIHTPETEREKQIDNLRKDVLDRGIKYPVIFDAAAENWKAWGNHTWPSVYLIDKQGRVRYWWYGELNWQGADGEQFMRKKLQELLAEK
jgi:thiol-disulfide isomerase/thioredoxin